MVQQQAHYDDDTPNNFPDDYDDTKVDSRVKLRSKAIRGKYRGVDVRGALAQGIEIAGSIASEANQIANSNAERQTKSEIATQSLRDETAQTVAALADQDAGGNAEVIKARNGHLDLDSRLSEPTSTDVSVTGCYSPGLFATELQEVRDKADASLFTIGLVTDTHWEPNPIVYGRSDLSLTHLGNIESVADLCDVVIAGGDNVNSYSTSLSYCKQYLNRFGAALLNGGKADRFALIGNHDDGSLRGTKINADKSQTISTDNILHISDFDDAYHFSDCLYGEVRDDASPWFYKDYPDSKVRVIGLMSEDVSETETVSADSTDLAYKRQWTFAYRQAQFDFLTSKALVVPDGYATIVFGHANLKADGDYGDDGMWINNGLLVNVLNAFKAGAKFVGSGTTAGFEATINVDFSTQGPRDLVGYFCGHLHKEYLEAAGAGTTGANFPHVVCLASLNQVSADTGTPNEDGWDLIQLDTANKHCKLLGFGRATDREFDY